MPGHGGPPVGPYDIVIEGNMITDMIAFDPVTAERRGETERVSGDRVIDATGKYVMPGMIDLHIAFKAATPIPPGICLLSQVSTWGYNVGAGFRPRIG